MACSVDQARRGTNAARHHSRHGKSAQRSSTSQSARSRIGNRDIDATAGALEAMERWPDAAAVPRYETLRQHGPPAAQPRSARRSCSAMFVCWQGDPRTLPVWMMSLLGSMSFPSRRMWRAGDGCATRGSLPAGCHGPGCPARVRRPAPHPSFALPDIHSPQPVPEYAMRGRQRNTGSAAQRSGTQGESLIYHPSSSSGSPPIYPQ